MNKEQLNREVAERAKTAGKNPGGKSAYADLVIETVQPNHLSLDLFNLFMPTRQMNAGDQFVKRVRRSRFPVRTLVPSAKHLHDQLSFVEQQTTMFDRLVTGWSASQWEIENGEVGTVESMRTELRADLFDELVSKVFTLLATVWNSTTTPNNYIDASATGVTSTALDTALETVLETAGNVKAIVGSRRALLPIYTFAQYREFVLGGTGNNPDRAMFPTSALDEFTRTGKVSTYKGVPLIELPQVYRNRLGPMATGTLKSVEQRMIPTDRVLVIGDNVGEVALMGPTVYQDYTDMTTIPPNYVLFCYQAYGMIVDAVDQIVTIKTNT